jgi:fluoride ion exporter CrcB/FEX
LKFGDVVTAVASLVVIDILLDSVLLAVFVPVNSYWAPDVAGILSVLVASLIVGYLFAVKIQEESRRGAIGRIVVLSAVVLTFATMAMFANPYMGTAINEGLESTYSTSGWTTWDWVAYSQFVMVMLVALNVVIALVFGFIGLYAGSMLKKPKKW